MLADRLRMTTAAGQEKGPEFIYVGGDTTQRARKYHIGNLAYVGETVDYGGLIRTVAIS